MAEQNTPETETDEVEAHSESVLPLQELTDNPSSDRAVMSSSVSLAACA
ncbi:hypothetical protein GXW83_22565 [Streptacidiphilus sp. PB12-B1b]|nr:hypothetical protein [Streptacidiphilus sp. PB12-B1b]QMU78064.1 hypothetical protein GXW83_22565 [Streptacidiphilus sp. PB12-B1b]